jgi:DNA replication protein DnaC
MNDQTNLALVPFKAFICPTCKIEITDPNMHGWVRDRNFGPETHWKQGILPCPTCSDKATAHAFSAKVARLFADANIPQRAKDWNFSTTPGDVDQVAIARCANFSNKQTGEHGLYLFGEYGCGKTGLAISIIQAAMLREEDALFIRSLDLLDRVRQAIARRTDDGDDLLQLTKSVRWLALDDLAAERPTDFVLEKLQSLLEARRDSGLYTVITSNYSYRDLEAQWRPDDVKAGMMHPGRRLIERLAEYCKPQAMKGRNLRRSVTNEGKVRQIR